MTIDLRSLTSSGAILIVEDPFVTSLLRSLLAKHGFSVACSSVNAAREALRGPGMSADLLITNRPSLFAEAGDRVPLLYLSACPDPDEVAAFRNCVSLPKPFQPRELLEAINELLGCAAVR